MTLFIVVLFSLVIGVIVGISVAPTVYEMHAAYMLAIHGEEGEDE